MLSRIKRKVSVRQNIEKEILTAAEAANQRRIDACKRKQDDNRIRITWARKRVEKLNNCRGKYEILDKEVTSYYVNYTLLLDKTLRDLFNLKYVQINRETALLKKVEALEKDESSQDEGKHSDEQGLQGTRNVTADLSRVNDSVSSTDVQENCQDKTLNALVAASNERFAALQRKLEGKDRLDKTIAANGASILKEFFNFRKNLQSLKIKLIEYAEQVEEERQRLCLVKCLRIKREIIILGELKFLSETINRREEINRAFQKRLAELQLKKCRKLCNPFFHKCSLRTRHTYLRRLKQSN